MRDGDRHRARLRPAARVSPRSRPDDLAETTRDLYGLGEQFVAAGTMDGTWMGRDRTPGNDHGNAMVGFDGNPHGGGAVGNAQFPVLYAAGPGSHAYAMFVDDIRAERWSFKADPWTLASPAETLRWYVIAGPDLAALHRAFMDLVGHPPVPPKKAFGLWISEYGFDDWHELEDKLRTLRAHHFPVDGFVLDLQWFGGVTEKSDASRMGALAFDRTHFPAPEKRSRGCATTRASASSRSRSPTSAAGCPSTPTSRAAATSCATARRARRRT